MKPENRGRKKYKDPKKYSVNIQIYRKQEDIEIIGGMDEARKITGTAFDQALIKKLKK